LLDLVLTGGARVLLRGTPGIGKTQFSLLLVLRLVAEGKTVVYMRGVKDSSALFYLILTPTGLLETDRHPAALPYLRDEATIFVVDAKEPKKHGAGERHDHFGVFSPARKLRGIHQRTSLPVDFLYAAVVA